MSTEHPGSIAFLLGLNEFQNSAAPHEQNETHPQAGHALLADLNAVPTNETHDDAMTTFANQLSLWTNASFSFDGPMGHALLAEDEKDGKPSQSDEEKREDEERNRQRAASSAHSNAARDKLLAVDREPMSMPTGFDLPSSMPSLLSMPAGTAPSPQAPWLGAPGPPPAPAAPETTHASAQGAESAHWDLTSTLALQYLLNKNPNVVANLWQGQGQNQNQSKNDASSAPGPSTAAPPASVPWTPSPSTSMPPPPAPTLSSAAPPAAPPSLQRKRSSSSVEANSTSGAEEPRLADEASQPGASGTRARSTGASLTDRVKLVDTGNPEADAEANRLAIEEDKRRRNTAASARFRIKKKQREAALEMSARELESQVHELKQENERLRTENEWLRRLITVRPEGLSAVMGAPVGQAPYPGLLPPLNDAAHPPVGPRPDTRG